MKTASIKDYAPYQRHEKSPNEENPNEKSDLDLEIETDAEVNESGELVHAEVANVESELDDKEDSTEEPLGYFKTGKDVYI